MEISQKRRMVEFIQEIYPKYQNQHIAIVAHQAPQFALERIANEKNIPLIDVQQKLFNELNFGRE